MLSKLPLKKNAGVIHTLIELNKKLRELPEVKFYLVKSKNISKLILIDKELNYRSFLWFKSMTVEGAQEELVRSYAFFRRDKGKKIPGWMDCKYFNVGYTEFKR